MLDFNHSSIESFNLAFEIEQKLYNFRKMVLENKLEFNSFIYFDINNIEKSLKTENYIFRDKQVLEIQTIFNEHEINFNIYLSDYTKKDSIRDKKVNHNHLQMLKLEVLKFTLKQVDLIIDLYNKCLVDNSLNKLDNKTILKVLKPN